MKKNQIVIGTVVDLQGDHGYIKVQGLSKNVLFSFSDFEGILENLFIKSVVEFQIQQRKGNKYKAKKVKLTDKPRTVIKHIGLPMSVPIYALSLENSVEMLTKEIDENGVILFTWFRDFVNDMINTGSPISKQNKQMLKLVNENFPNHKVDLFNWPSLYRSNNDTYRSSHPYISRKCRLAITVSRKDFVVDPEQIKQSLMKSVYDDIINKSKDKWTILGDETGSLHEFSGRERGSKKSEMCWVVVPPDTNLPALNSNFHSTGNLEDLTRALIGLKENPNVLLYSFPYEEGKSSAGLQGVASDPHLDFWQDTLPLVLEDLSKFVEKPTEINIFVEQVGPLESGIGVIAPLVRELKSALSSRNGWSNFSFGEESSVISKKPCEHPWIGYSDALGHIRVDKKNWHEKQHGDLLSLVLEIRKRVKYIPYRKNSLNGSIKSIILDSANPLKFLKSLPLCTKSDIRDYVRPFMENAIIESRNSLSTTEWQSLLNHFKNTAETIQGQHAANLVLDGLDIDSVIHLLNKNEDKYLLLKSVLGSSNHVGTTKVANKCKTYIDDLLSDGLILSKRELKKLRTLQAGANDNQFDWAHISELDEHEDDVIEWDEETQHFFGSQALSRALRNESRDWDEANEIEEKLRSIHQSDVEYRRRYILYAELMTMKFEFQHARAILELELPEILGDSDNSMYLNDSYYLATLLKTCALSGQKNLFEDYSSYVLKNLDDKHPSQRIAYWYCRWAHHLIQIESEEFVDEMDLNVLDLCLEHIVSLKKKPFYQKEAPGVILACELIDLNKRGLLEEDQDLFLEQVLANSEVFANEWVSKYPPNEDDWLAPLNFNYR